MYKDFNPSLSTKTILVKVLILIPFQAEAYMGPGMGLGIATVIAGFIVAFTLLIIGLIYFPLRRIYRKLKKTRKDDFQT